MMEENMNRLFFTILLIPALSSCHENLEDRSAREAKEYTEKYCPTPVVNGSRTDSVTFQKETKTYTYYCSFVGKLDNAQIVARNRGKIHRLMVKEIKDNTSIRKLKDAKYNFAYVVHSDKDPRKILYQQTIRVSDYQ